MSEKVEQIKEMIEQESQHYEASNFLAKRVEREAALLDGEELAELMDWMKSRMEELNNVVQLLREKGHGEEPLP